MKSKKKTSVITAALMVFLIVTSSTTLISSTTPLATASTVSSTTVPSDMLKYEWPMPGADAAHTNCIGGPSLTTPNIEWKTSVSGIVAGPFAFNGYVFVRTPTSAYALDGGSGGIIWNISIPYTPYAFLLGSIAKLDDTYMLIGSSCYKIADGSLVWTGPVGFGAPGSPQSSSYIPELKMLVSGDLAWSLSDPSKQPTLLWNRTTDASNAKYGPVSFASQKAYGNGIMVYGTGLDYLLGVNVTNGQTVWVRPVTTGFTFGGSYYNGTFIYGGYDGNMQCWNISTGELIWTYNPGTYYNEWAYNTAIANGIVYERNQDNYLYAVNATTGQLIWKARGPGVAYTNYLSISGGLVFCQMGENQYRDFATGDYGYSEFDAYNATTGELVWSEPFENGSPQNLQCSAYGNLYVVPTQSTANNGTYAYTGGSADGAGTLNEVWCIGNTPKDWSMFLSDPTHSADSGTFGPANVTLKWKLATDGEIVGSPVFVNGVGYFGSKDGNIYAFNAASGTKIWNYSTPYMVFSTPAVVNGKLYTGAESGYILALDATTGAKLWETTIPGIGYGKPIGSTSDTIVSSPIVYNGYVYLGASNGIIYCLDANSGSITWQVPTGGVIYATPTIVEDALYITSSTPQPYGAVLKLDIATGQILLNVTIPYNHRTQYQGDFFVASPTVANGMIYVRAGLYSNYALNATTGQTIWTYNATINSGTPSQNGGTYQFGAPLYKYGLLYINDYYSITALNAFTGSIVWQSYTSREDIAQGISYSYGKIYVVNEAGIMHVLDAQTGKSLSFYAFNTQMRSIPTPYNGSLYVGTNDWNLYCFSEAPPATVVSTDITFELRPSSIVKGETVIVAGSINNLHSAVPMNVYFGRGDSSLPVNISAVTDDNGGFTVKFVPDMAGDWTVVVSWTGDATHTACSSQSQTLTVTEPATPPPTATPQSMADLYFLPGIIGVIVTIIVVGAVIIFTLRKRP